MYLLLQNIRPIWADIGCFLLFCAENTVACITQTGNDVAVLVEAFVQRTGVDVHIGVTFLNALDALGGSNQNQQLDVLAATFFHLVDGGRGRTAGCQHGINNNNIPVGNILGGLTKIGNGLKLWTLDFLCPYV